MAGSYLYARCRTLGRALCRIWGRTRMRTPCVKRHTDPLSGFLRFFRLSGPDVVSNRCRALTLFLCTGAHAVWRHQTRIEVLSSRARRLQSSFAVILCDLAMLSSPHTVLRKGLAEHAGAPVRLRFGRGAAHSSLMRQALYIRARASVQSTRRAQGRAPMSYCAFHDAGLEGFAHDDRSGCSHACPVRLQAHLLCSRSR
jgi:hypothetical protein